MAASNTNTTGGNNVSPSSGKKRSFRQDDRKQGIHKPLFPGQVEGSQTSNGQPGD